MLPTNRQVKLDGKQSMVKTMPLWFRATLFFVGAQLFLQMGKRFIGGSLGWYLIPIDKLPEAVSGFTSLQNGFEFILRMDMMDVVAVISLTYTQIAMFLLVNALILILLAPAKLCVLDCCWRAFRGEHTGDFSPLLWYRKPKRFAKAVWVSLILDVGCTLLEFLLLIPYGILFLWLYTGDWMKPGAVIGWEANLLALLAIVLLLGGLLVAFAIHSILYPLAYCLAAQPDYSLSKIWKRGLASIKGVRRRFVGFRLSFLPWFLLSSFTAGITDLYVLPYLSFTSFQFLQETAKAKATEAA